MNDVIHNGVNAKSSFSENFYATVFEPSGAFEQLKANPRLGQAIGVVAIVSSLNTLLNFSPDGVLSVFLLVFSVLAAAIGGLISWVFFAGFVNLLAVIFREKGNFEEFICLSAFALLPWVFLAPIELLKSGGTVLQAFGGLLGLAVWLWTVLLMGLAVAKSYNLPYPKAFLLLAVPLIAGVIGFSWMVGFFTTLAGVTG